jgi:hypothetical protein
MNISSATADAWQPGGPWDAQANVVKALTDARHNLAGARGGRRFAPDKRRFPTSAIKTPNRHALCCR